MAATTRNAAPMAARPVTWYRVVTTPATTVSGATALRMKKTTAGTPRRSLARAAETLPLELGEDMVSCISVSGAGKGRRLLAEPAGMGHHAVLTLRTHHLGAH